MSQRWRFLNTGYADGPRNMAIDEALLRTMQMHGGCAVLRVYGWKPAAISVGYHQDVLHDLDVAQCNHARIRIVRRLTGGRAVFHDEEVTYSVVAPENDPSIGRTISETYERIGAGLVGALRHLGIIAELQRSTVGGWRNPSCFSSTGRHEVVYRGRKLIGSAQRRIGGIVLQHGSLLTGPAYEKLMDLLRPGESRRFRQPTQGVTTLSEIIGSTPSSHSISEAIRSGFELAFNVQFMEADISEEELTLAEKLRVERYEKEEWNLGRPSRLR